MVWGTVAGPAMTPWKLNSGPGVQGILDAGGNIQFLREKRIRCRYCSALTARVRCARTPSPTKSVPETGSRARNPPTENTTLKEQENERMRMQGAG